MNIVKLKDQVKEGDAYFNEHLRGKYAFWVRQLFVVSFDEMDQITFSQAEQTTGSGLFQMKTDRWYDVLDLMDYIDSVETNRINDITTFLEYNQKTPDSDLTIDDLKRFRTWLAEELLEQKICGFDIEPMLQYYKAAMWDPAATNLSLVSAYSDVQLTYGSGCACGCGSSLTLAELYGQLSATCDSLAIYRKSMYNWMVTTFSDLNFWMKVDVDLLRRFKTYIDNLLKMEMIPGNTSYVQPFAECGCTTDLSSNNRNILEKLRQALEYLTTCGVTGHKNFIREAFNSWAMYLYELMYWE